MNELKIILLIISSLLLSSCNIGLSGSEDYGNFTGTIQLGHVNPIPYSTTVGDYVLLPITNNTNHTMFLSKIEVIINNNRMAYGDYLDTTNCNTVAIAQTCYLKIFANKHDGYLLNLEYIDSNQNSIHLKQMISFSNNLPQNNGVIISSQGNWISHLSGLNVPVVLNRKYAKIVAALGDMNVPVICAHPNGSAHNMCTIVVPAMNVSNLNNILKIIASNENTAKFADYYTSTIILNKNISGNIVASAINSVVSPSNGNNPTIITLLNNGLESVTTLSISGVTPLLVQSNNCSGVLNSSQTCSFSINASSTISGQSTVIISYTNASGAQIMVLNVTYISNISSPLLTFISNGSFSNITTSQSSYTYLIVHVLNNGNVALSNLQFNNLNLVNSNMVSFATGSTCSNGGNLAIGGSCNMVLGYDPTNIQSGTVRFIVTGSYNYNGEVQTYSNSSITIPYSAVSASAFKAVGDFGMVITSPAGAAGTWVANVDSPFATASTSANNLLINNNTYVMTTSTGSIKYSKLDGLFWKTSLLGGGNVTFSSSKCSVVYDGNYYYTCGMLSGNFDTSSPCSLYNKGCVVRSSNPENNDWWGVFTPSQLVTVNDVGYFSNGVVRAYVASIASTVANSGVATSSDGLAWSWTANSSSQTTAANNNFSPIVYNSESATLSIYSSTGRCSLSNFSSITSWSTCNGTVSSESFSSAIYNNKAYIFSTNTGIYTSTPNANAALIKRATVSNLNKISFAHNINGGTYLAVGNSGVNLTTNDPTATWIAKTALKTGQSTNPNLTGINYDGTNFWVTGVSSILKSSDAVNWVTPSLQSITKVGSGYLAVDNQGNIFFSSDSNLWQKRVNPTLNTLNSIYCSETSLCFAVGNNGTILKSTDSGVTWSQLNSGTSTSLKKVTCRNGACMIVGGGSLSNSGIVLFSNDYTNWSIASSSLSTTALNDIAYYNNMYITVGNTGAVFISVNSGISWNSITSGTVQNLNSIICADSVGCVVVGNAGVILSSSFGNSWSAATSSTTNDLLSVAYNGVFVTVGKGGVLRYSTSGSGTWSSATFPTTSSATNNLTAVISG